MKERRFRFSGFVFDVDSLVLEKSGASVALRPQAAMLLKILLESSPGYVSRTELHDTLWDAHTDVEVQGALNALVRELRSALGDSADKELYIVTLPKRGYQFSGKIRQTRNGARLIWAMAAVLLTAVGVTIAGIEYRAQQRPDPRQPILLAVLPANLQRSISGDTPTEFQAALRITAALREMPPTQLRVIGTEAVQSFGNRSILDFGDVGADYVLETTIYKDNAELVVEADLHSVVANVSEARFLRRYPDYPSLVNRAVPHDIVAWVGNHFGLQRTIGRSSIERQQNPAVVAALIEARWARELDGMQSLGRASKIYDDVLRDHPRNKEALSGKLLVLMKLAGTPEQPVLETYDAINDLALTLRDLGGAGAVADLGFAFVSLNRDWDIERALRHVESSLIRDPQNALAHAIYSAVRAASGDVDGAIESSEVSLRLKPDTWARADLCFFLLAGRQLERAAEFCERAHNIAPKEAFTAILYAVSRYELGDEASAIDVFVKIIREADSEAFRPPAEYPKSWQDLGCHRAERLSRWFEADDYTGDYANSSTVAQYWAQCGDKEKLLYWIRKSMQSKGLAVVFYRLDPRFYAWWRDADFLEAIAPIYAPAGHRNLTQ